MIFAITEEQTLLGESVQRLLAEANEFETRRRRLRANPPDRMALWPQLLELGAVGAAFDEAHGGFAGDPRTVAVVMAQLGASLAVEPYLATVIAGRILQAATGGPCAQVIENVQSGAEVCVLAHDGGSNPFAAPALQATSAKVVSGTVRCVRHADVATSFLVPVRVGDTIAIYHVPRDHHGLTITCYRLLDGAGGGDLIFKDAPLSAASKLEFDADAQAVLHDALEWGVLGLAAETAGIVEALNKATFSYLNTRKQFGTTLSSFQALQHRAADMFIAAEEIIASADSAIEALGNPPSPARSAMVSAAKVVADTGGRRVGHESVQMHGGMGVSDELNVSHYARRLATIRAELGSVDQHRFRFSSLRAAAGENLATVSESEEARQWRIEVRNFVRTHLPADLARKVELGLELEKADYVRWQKILYENGWFAGAWPKEYGGQGWSLMKQLVFAQEAAICNAPSIIPYGVNMVGPVIYTYGTEEQKRQHLPGILSSDVWWCQGYSEPGSGSDLASLKTFAERDGDYYVVNGTKMWTTEAHWADMMHCLVRTDRSVKPQQGITFLLIDMKTPGISIQPIITIDGVHHTNQTFFDNVRVPVANRVGEEGFGWTIAKFLLGNERTSIADTGAKLRLLRHVHSMHDAFVADPSMSQELKTTTTAKLADLEIQLITLCRMEARYVDAWSKGKPVGAEASLLKIRGTEILQALTELALELEGPMAAAHDPEDLHLSPDVELKPSQRASLIAHEYLYGRCWSIFGGTNEIQRNIIARQVLGG
jgi:alkylation response protein AidB-like acyl-CoA dehydrogenase